MNKKFIMMSASILFFNITTQCMLNTTTRYMLKTTTTRVIRPLLVGRLCTTSKLPIATENQHAKTSDQDKSTMELLPQNGIDIMKRQKQVEAARIEQTLKKERELKEEQELEKNLPNLTPALGRMATSSLVNATTDAIQAFTILCTEL